MRPTIKNPKEIEKMRAAGRLAAETLDFITPYVEPGVSTAHLDQLCHDFIIKHGAIPAPLNYRGYPKSICTSINDVICHGIPSEKDVLKEGDIMNIDVTVILDGYHGDTSRMYAIGPINKEVQLLIDVTHRAMMAAIQTLQSGSWLSDIAKAIQAEADPFNYGVVREFVGHGLGKSFHEEPQVLHYWPNDMRDIRMRKGYTLTIEPMINIGTWESRMIDGDGWTARTKDGTFSAQFEHTLLVSEEGCEILTKSPSGLDKPVYKKQQS